MAKDNGIVIPVLAAAASTKVGLGYAAACALLVQETGGGRNVYGHDPTIFIGAGKVTETNYAEYKKLREETGQYQGVGPTQLTWGGYQDQADDLGGCWDPLCNMLVGFGIIQGYRDRGYTWHEAWQAYNGSSAYADQMVARQAQWQQILNP